MQTIKPEPFTDTLAVAGKLVDRAFADGGATLDRWTGENARVHGFVVGGRAPGLSISDARQTVGTLMIVGRYLQALDTNITKVGSWIDDGVLYIDAVDDIWSFGEAIDLAAERGELAIYEPASGETFTVANFNINQQ